MLLNGLWQVLTSCYSPIYVYNLRNNCSEAAKVKSRVSTLLSMLSCCPDISDNTWMGADDEELTPTLQMGVGSGTSHPSLGAGVWFVSDIVLAAVYQPTISSGQLWLWLHSSHVQLLGERSGFANTSLY